MDAAYEAELVMGLAADRPEPTIRRRVIPVRGGGVRARRCPGTSEFLPDELALVLNCSRSFARACSPTPAC